MLGLLVFIGGACDPLDEETGANSVAAAKTSVAEHDDPGAKAKAKSKAKSESAAPTTPPPGLAGGAPAAFKAPPGVDHETIKKALGTYRSCVFECMDDRKAKETDRESCKLTCRSNAEIAGVDPDAPGATIADRFDLCTADCYDPKIKATDRETCKLNCEAVAESLQGTLEFADPVVGAGGDGSVLHHGCAQSCMQQRSKCERLCDEQDGPETDRETCRLLCGTNGEICLGSCNVAMP
ncbi:MAG TPA: hypothetical protein ENJ18_00450 [Nannocystis exedens]|nr:hypothetical protein [Nannocystis exedens]